MERRIKWGLAGASLAALVAACWLGWDWTVQRSVRRQVEEAAARSALVEEVRLGSLDVGPLRRGGEASDLRLRLKGGAGVLTVERLTVSDLQQGDAFPGRLRLEARAIRIEGGNGAPQRLLADLGYPRPTADLSVAYRYDAANRNLAVERLTLTLREGGTLRLTGEVGNVDAARILQAAREPAQLLLLLAGLSVKGFEAHYTDASLAERWQRAMAARQGSTPDQWRQETAARLERLAQGPKNAALQRELGVLRDFVMQPRGLSVTAAPEKPVAVLQLFLSGGGEELIRLLGLHLTTQG
jgi:hypothetical protein